MLSLVSTGIDLCVPKSKVIVIQYFFLYDKGDEGGGYVFNSSFPYLVLGMVTGTQGCLLHACISLNNGEDSSEELS